MTFAWYGHLKLAEYSWFNKLSLFGIIVSAGRLPFEYCFQVGKQNRLYQQWRTLSLVQLKVLQEVITLIVFVIFSYVVFQAQIRPNHIIGFALGIGSLFHIQIAQYQGVGVQSPSEI